jgi:integrase
VISQQPSGRWRVRLYDSGRFVSSKTFDLKRDAAAWEREQERQLLAGQWIDPKAGSGSLASVIEDFLKATEPPVANPHTYKTDSDNLQNHVPKRLLQLPIRAITSGLLEGLYDDLVRKKLARSTINRIRDSLSALFAWAVRQGLIRDNPVARSKKTRRGKPAREMRPFTAAEMEDTLRQQALLNPYYALVTEFTVLTGLRWGEIVALKVKDLRNFDTPAIIVKHSKSTGFKEKDTKNTKARVVPLVPRAEEIFALMTDGKLRTSYVFTAPQGGQLNGGNFKRATSWAKSSNGHTFHELRHTAATNWFNIGIAPAIVSEWLGHASVAFTQTIYVHHIKVQGNAAALAIIAAAAPTTLKAAPEVMEEAAD